MSTITSSNKIMHVTHELFGVIEVLLFPVEFNGKDFIKTIQFILPLSHKNMCTHFYLFQKNMGISINKKLS